MLIDMRLPDGDGATVFHAVHAANPDTRTVLITGHPRELDQLVQQVLHDGADAVCYKPFDVANLLATVERLAREPSAGSGLRGHFG